MEEALNKGAELLKNKPNLSTEKIVSWDENMKNESFGSFCELLKGNAIPTEKLTFSRLFF